MLCVSRRHPRRQHGPSNPPLRAQSWTPLLPRSLWLPLQRRRTHGDTVPLFRAPPVLRTRPRPLALAPTPPLRAPPLLRGSTRATAIRRLGRHRLGRLLPRFTIRLLSNLFPLLSGFPRGTTTLRLGKRTRFSGYLSMIPGICMLLSALPASLRTNRRHSSMLVSMLRPFQVRTSLRRRHRVWERSRGSTWKVGLAPYTSG